MVFSQIEHLIKIVNDLWSKCPMVCSQIEHLIKMANDF
jgi:hypothetical protein